MDVRLTTLISAYQAGIADALRLLEQAGIPRPDSNTAWAINAIPPTGRLDGDASYRKHGFGCEVQWHDRRVDFDFGPQGETTGLDLWRLQGFAAQDLARYGFASGDELEQALHASIKAGELVKSGHLYHRAPAGD